MSKKNSIIKSTKCCKKKSILYQCLVSGRSSKNSDLSVEQFSVWVKHYYAFNFLFFGSYSAYFLDFKVDPAQTEI